ncbi:MAG: type III polyketide synthase [Phycisphaerales bacterium]
MNSKLLAIGVATPPTGVSQERAAELAVALTGSEGTRSRAIRELYRRSGVERRGSVAVDASGESALFARANGNGRLGPSTQTRLEAYARHAGPLALEACRDCLERAGVDAGRVTHLVTVSCTGFEAPGVDIGLMRALGLASTTKRTNVGFMGCHGAINGIRVADAFVRADPRHVVLVCCVELCSVHFQYGSGEGIAVANALFADGAAACLIASEGVGDGAPAIRGTGSMVFPDSEREMGWRIGDHGFEMRLTSRVPELLRAHVGGWMDAWLGEHGLGRSDVRAWAVHPGGPRVIEAVREGLEIEADIGAESRRVLRECGNMSSATVLFIVRAMLEGGAGTPLVAMAFGPGLTGEAAVIG